MFRQQPGLTKGFYLILLLVSCTAAGFAQSPMVRTNCPRMRQQADHWYFGEKAGIDFRTGTAVADTTENVMSAFKATAVISDSAGNLLFFTNGNKVWDRGFNLMDHGQNLMGDLGVTQPCIIVPAPGDPAIYYIFTQDVLAFKPDNSFTTEGMRYTVIDLRLRSSMGDATILNAPLLSPSCQKLTAVMHQNKRSVWVLAHAWNSNAFYAYLITDKGITDSVISQAGTVHGGGYVDQVNAEGAMKASPDGKYLALAISGKNMVELFSFNNQSGTVSLIGSAVMPKAGVVPYGIEFSPDSRKLYTSLLQRTGSGPPSRPSYIYQFDCGGGLQNPVLIDSVAANRIGFMQLATDGRIYLSRTVNHLVKKDSVDVIYNPNRPGAECNFSRLNHVPGSRFYLEGRSSIYSLPNFIQTYFDIPAFRWDSVCHGDVTKFTIVNKANIDSVSWDFGDGSFSTVLEPLHTYAQPGNYHVKLTEKFNGNSFTDSATVRSYALPVVKLGADTILLYSGSSINLHAGGGYMEYQWTTGSRDSVITVESQGKYRVWVKDFNCCLNNDSIYVKVFEYIVPSAFTPNNDGLNDIFRVIGLYRNISFRMSIYNRWGEQVFESDDIDKGWDGAVKGKYCEPGSYAWVVKINFLSQDIITQGDIVLKGTVTLIR